MNRRGSRNTALIRILVVLLILSLTLPLFLVRCAGCDSRADVTLWHSFAPDSTEDLILMQSLGQIAAESPSISLAVSALGDNLGTALAGAISRNELPDIIIAPAEWAPMLDRAGLLIRAPLEEEDEWLPGVVGSLVRDSQLLGFPVFCSTVGLARAQVLSDRPWPATVAALAAAATAAAAANRGLYWPLADAYYTLPWFLGAGGRLEPPVAPGQNPPWEGPAPVDGQAARAWLVAGVAALAPVVPADRRTAPPLQGWLEGRVGYAPVTPQEWALMRASAVDAELGELPGGVPFLSTWVAMLPRSDATAPVNSKAVELLVRLRTDDDDGLLYLASSLGMLPPLAKHFASEVMVASGLDAFEQLAKDALPMPAGRYAAEVWAAYESALTEFLAGAKADDVVERLKDVVTTLTGGTPP